MERETGARKDGAIAKLSVVRPRSMTSGEAVAFVAEALREAGIDDARVDARLLVAAVLRATSLDLIREPGRALDAAEQDAVVRVLDRRLKREPVSRILGVRGFYGRDFTLSPATLDPRPCSETLVEAVLEVVREEGREADQLSILDVGTGSGCLAITLLAELPHARGVATDISEGALATARENAELHGVGARLTLAERSYLDGVDGVFDILVSNPPYIARGEIAGLEPEVRTYDPMAALDGGVDGLDAYRAIAAGLMRVVPEGWCFFEVGSTQADAVADILRSPFHIPPEIRVWNDLGGHTRCVAMRTHYYP